MKKIVSLVMSPVAFLAWAARLNLSKAATEIIRRIRTSPPVRRTQGRCSVRGEWCSAKMGRTIQFESASGELASIIEDDSNPDVLEFWDQPCTFKLNYRDKNKRPIGVMHTPDFFVIGKTGAWWKECKPEAELLELAKTMPHRYVRQPDGTWRCPPGEAYAAQYGLGYEVRSAAQNNYTLVRNMLHLGDYHRADCPAPTEKIAAAVKAAIRIDEGLTFRALLRAVPGATSDILNYLIARGIIYVDLRNVLMVDLDSVVIFSDATIAQAIPASKQSTGESIAIGSAPVVLEPTRLFVWDGKCYTISDADARFVITLDEDKKTRVWQREELERHAYSGKIKGVAPTDKRPSEVHAKIMQAGPVELKIATDRWHQLQSIMDPLRAVWPKGESAKRQLRRIKAKYDDAKALYGNGFVGLIPAVRIGNTKSTTPEEVTDLMNEVAETFYDTLEDVTQKSAHDRLVKLCNDRTLPAPALKTWCRFLRNRSEYKSTLKRKGPRAAYQKKPFVWLLDIKTPVHGDRPWQYVHIDHTVLDLELICSRTGKNLGRPTLTVMLDAHTRRVLAFSVSFAHESSLSIMRVLRECVRRHGRLPQFLILDQGKGHNSVYLDALLASYEISKKSRPAAFCRAGSVGERIFGTTNLQFIHNLQGNTKITKNVREATKSVAPEKLAIWTLEALTVAAAKYFYETYDIVDHPALGVSPRVWHERAMAETGLRSHMLIAYDHDFLVATMPTTKNGTAKVHNQKGIRVNYLDYHSSDLAAPDLHGKKVPVRSDDENASIVYVFLKGKWRPCISSYANVFEKWSQRAVEIASLEILRSRKLVAKDRNNVLDATGTKRTSISARILADFLEDMRANEDLLLLQAKELAARSARKDTKLALTAPQSPVRHEAKAPSAAEDLNPFDVALQSEDEITPFPEVSK